jgi:TPP-dependent 2-oxoacid decarboxylase
MDALYSRYAALIRAGDSVVLETGSSSLGLPPMPLADDVQVHIQMLWGSIGWATGAALAWPIIPASGNNRARTIGSAIIGGQQVPHPARRGCQ